MADKLSNPNRVEVKTEISFHELLGALEQICGVYPADRLDVTPGSRLEDVAHEIRKRLSGSYQYYVWLTTDQGMTPVIVKYEEANQLIDTRLYARVEVPNATSEESRAERHE